MSELPLLLRIENMDTLPDGGPVRYELDRRGLDIGRDPYLDWTLPDPERFISGKHCEIRYRDGGYWLHDVSTNGTSVNGRGGRLTEPHRLQDGDRIHIGQYIIAVELSGEEPQAGAADVASASSGGGADPWGGIDSPAAAVNRRDFAAHALAQGAQPGPRGPADLAEEDISWGVGRVTQGEPPADSDIWGARPSGGAGRAADEWGWTPSPSSPETSPDLAAAGPVRGAGGATGPAGRVEPPAPRVDPFSGVAAGAAAEPATISPEATPIPAASASGSAATGVASPASGLASRWTDGGGAPQARPAPTTTSLADAGDFVAAFERGAGMPAGSVAERGDEALAEELGLLFRLVTQNLQAMLAARAETKSAMRSSERTMIGALENNPLKFSPTPQDALRIMFGAKTRSYLDATQTVESSFRDLQQHQVQTFAAMQQALQALIEDLDPASIEEATSRDGGLAGIVGSRRAKFWDTYVERFRAKSARHERGLIDAFMILFAEMYDRQR